MRFLWRHILQWIRYHKDIGRESVVIEVGTKHSTLKDAGKGTFPIRRQICDGFLKAAPSFSALA